MTLVFGFPIFHLSILSYVLCSLCLYLAWTSLQSFLPLHSQYSNLECLSCFSINQFIIYPSLSTDNVWTLNNDSHSYSPHQDETFIILPYSTTFFQIHTFKHPPWVSRPAAKKSLSPGVRHCWEEGAGARSVFRGSMKHCLEEVRGWNIVM